MLVPMREDAYRRPRRLEPLEAPREEPLRACDLEEERPRTAALREFPLLRPVYPDRLRFLLPEPERYPLRDPERPRLPELYRG